MAGLVTSPSASDIEDANELPIPAKDPRYSGELSYYCYVQYKLFSIEQAS